MIPTDNPTAVIVTAISAEFQAVIAHLIDVREVVDIRGMVYEYGIFTANGRTWKVAVAECGEGNVSAATMICFADAQFQPDLILFVGVAGSLKDDILLGHVIASNIVYMYHSGKAQEHILTRPRLEFAGRSLDQRARATARRSDWVSRIKYTDLPPGSAPKAKVAPIAAGELVVASDLSEAYGLIRSHYNDAHAVEMEGYGALRAARDLGVQAIVVRGISDNVVDKSACDAKGWQPIAAAHASAFAFEMLANIDLGHLGRSRRPIESAKTQIAAESLNSSIQTLTTTGVIHSDAMSSVNLASIRQAFILASETLLNWPTSLDDGRWITRPELRQLQDFISQSASDPILVLGLPGSGKSALLSKLARWCVDGNLAVLAIRADVIPTLVTSSETLAEYLGFTESVESSVRKLASSQLVVVLIDQLDALAALVDLRSTRLNVLLGLIKTLHTIPNVKVVCSCREFEYQHDARLARIDAETVHLSLPDWEVVSRILSEHRVHAASWPQDRREVLQTPQHLNVFLRRLHDTSEEAVFRNYRQLYEDLWKRKILPWPERNSAVNRIAEYLAEEESLWAPASRFDDQSDVVDQLVAENILVRPEHMPRIGFQHQTLFEHARARAFASGNGSIAEYSIARQDGLFIRPALWATISYLRDAAPAEYEREMRLFFQSDLRLHVQYLLIDFLGQGAAPSELEISLLSRQISDTRYRGRSLLAIRSNESWFRALQHSQIPACMTIEPSESWPVFSLLASAWPFARAECLTLIKTYWIPYAERDMLSWMALNELSDWDRDTVDLACTIVRRTRLETFRIAQLTEKIADSQPDLSMRVIAEHFNMLLRELESKSDPVRHSVQKLCDEEGKAASEEVYRSKERFDKLLSDSSGWYELPDLAKRRPSQFLRELGPWLIRVLHHTAETPHHIIRTFRHDYSSATALDEDSRLHFPVPTAFDNAVKELARIEISAFLRLASEWEALDLEFVQRLVARGFQEIVSTHPDRCLTFLIADPRRLCLGRRRDRPTESLRLISLLVPFLDPSQLISLENAIFQFSQYYPDVESEDFRTEGDHRLQLMLASRIPLDKLSESVRGDVMEFQRATHGFELDEDPDDIGWHRVDSPMSAQEMETADDQSIISLFDPGTYPEQQRYSDDYFRGGPREAAREMQLLAKQNSSRVESILNKLVPPLHELAAAYSIKGLSETDYPTSSLISLVAALDKRGFTSNEFRVEAAMALAELGRKNKGLDDATCDLLVNWLPSVARAQGDVSSGYSTSHDTGPILWGDGGLYTLPYGSYFILHALTFGYLVREKPATDLWITVLEEHLTHGDTVATWRAMLSDLRYLGVGKGSRAADFVEALFACYPEVLFSNEGVVFLARVWRFLRAPFVRDQLLRLRQSDWNLGLQAYGELLAYGALELAGNDWAVEEVSQHLEDLATKEDILLGIVYCATQLWEETNTRKAAGEYLVRVAARSNLSLANAITRVFWQNEHLPDDQQTKALLEIIRDQPIFRESTHIEYLVESLADFLPSHPDLVADLSLNILASRGRELASIQYSLAACAGAFIEISLTLQRLGGSARGKGLDIFEKLLELGLDEAQCVLWDLDKRPRSIPAPRARRRRKTA